MPTKAGVACTRGGCPGIVRGGVCSVCGPVRREKDARYNEKRESWQSAAPHWRKCRKMVLSASPLCVECKRIGAIVPATEVDHIIPKRDGGDDSFENLQALCKSCHSQKTRSGR